jgi:hypothetical protein
METNRFTLHRRALDALYQLRPEEQQQVNTALELFARIPRCEWPMEDFHRISEDEPRYLLHIPPRLRLFVRMEDGAPPEIEDIALRDQLLAFQTMAKQQGFKFK